MRRSRLAELSAGLTFALATLGVSAVPAQSTGTELRSVQEIRLPKNAAAPAQQDESFPSSTQNALLDSVSCTSAWRAIWWTGLGGVPDHRELHSGGRVPRHDCGRCGADPRRPAGRPER
jgi:hypothetical protein